MLGRFEFTRMRELVIASNVSSSLEFGREIEIAQEIRVRSNAGERVRSLGRFEFALMRERE